MAHGRATLIEPGEPCQRRTDNLTIPKSCKIDHFFVVRNY